ncbi:MAG: ATP-dependent helicase [Bacteroidota bacterium]|nr:ATP-dependent helicase [Bacteroidota bacterium]
MIGFSDLNENQTVGFSWDTGPLLLLAGPGSGKTAVLTLRVARLIQEDEDNSALALTFTNKAAAEMRQRVERLLQRRTNRARLCTFHKFAADLLRQHGSHIGIRPNFDLLTQREDRLVFLDEAIGNLPGSPQGIPTDRSNLLATIDRLFAEGYSGQGSSTSLVRSPDWMPGLFREYCDVLIRSNRCDYGGLLHFATRLLRANPSVAELTQMTWDYVCVDEFQDTNKAQYELLRLITPDRKANLFVVADDDQIIYQWNGASPKRFRELKQDYDLQVCQLPESYRCPPAIVCHANSLIAHNPGRSSKQALVSLKEMPPNSATPVRFKACDSIRDEAAFVGSEIRDWDLPPGDCAVLGRTNRLIREAAGELRSNGHEVYVHHPKSSFESPALQVIIEALRLAKLRHDRVVLASLCRAWQRLTSGTIEPHAIGGAAGLNGGDFLRAWVDAVAARQEDEYGSWADRIGSDLLDGLNFTRFIERCLDDPLIVPTDPESKAEFDEELDTFKQIHEDILMDLGPRPTLSNYLQQLDLMSKAPSPTGSEIQCLTIHGSKGLEFNHVFLVGMSQGVFPAYFAVKKGATSAQMQEERRNLFVAITRTKCTLTLTRSREYRGYRREPSQFLAEMGLGAS